MLIISISPFYTSEICPFIFIRLSYSQHKKCPRSFHSPSTFHYLCPHDEKVCRRHIAFAFVQLLHLLPARRMGGWSADRLPGGSAIRTEEILYSHRAQRALLCPHRIRSKGSVRFAGCPPDTASAAVQVLGMALRLLSLHARRRLQSCLTLWLEAGKRDNRRVQPRFRVWRPPAGEGTKDTGRALYRPGAMRDETGERDRHQEHTFCHQVTARQRGHLRKGRIAPYL